MSKYNTVALLQDMGLDVDQFISERNIDTPIDDLVLRYHELDNLRSILDKQIADIRSQIQDYMASSGQAKMESKFGQVTYVDQQERITYPKSDLDAIAKTNKSLRKILDQVSKRSTVSAYVRITTHT